MRALSVLSARRRGGFTLVEVLIAASVFAVVLSAIGLTVLNGKENFRQGVSASVIEARARRLLDRIVAELQWAGADTLPVTPAAPTGAAQVEFRVCTGFAGGASTWSGRTRIQRVADPADPQDGVDNDGDGVVDEGQVVLTRDLGTADEKQVVIGDGVRRLLEGEDANALDDNGNGLTDESGLSFVMDGDGTLRVRLSLEARDPHGQPLVRTVQTSVTLRN